MKLNDFKIGTQFRLGLGLILVLVVILGAIAWVQSDDLWQQTKGLYEHPHAVRRALGKLEVDVEVMSRQARDLFLVRNEQETMACLQIIEIRKNDAERQMDVLYDRYLGPREDVVALHEDLSKWNVLREETVRLFMVGKTAQAEARIQPGGAQNTQAEAVRSRLQKIDLFAYNKSEEFYRAAEEESLTLKHQMAVVTTIILLLTALVGWLLLKGIKGPITELAAAAEQFRQGQMDTRCGYVSENELGTLSASFNAMAEAIEMQMRINTNVAQLSDAMLREEEVQAFCRELLKGLLSHTGSQVGAVYFLNDAKTAFEHFESIGLGTGGRTAFAATEREGELGAAVATQRIQHLRDIPADTRFAFPTVSGNFMPREILTIPVLTGQTVTAVISLASVRAYDTASIQVVEEIWSVLTARVNGVLSYRNIQALVEKLEYQNRELNAQKEELAAQAGEMAAQSQELNHQNTELEMQKQELNESNRLKSAFLSNMSHELRTPLNSVIALSGVLNRRLANVIPADEYSYLEVIERNGKHLLSLINDILDLSRIEAGRAEISVSRFSVRELAGELVEMIKPQAVEKRVALLNQVPGDLPLIASDQGKCRHILQNLVGNAVKFTEVGHVTITAEVISGTFRMRVADTGIGIAATHLPHIFDEFRQADDSTSRKYGGTGLGLAIAKKYAVLLGGGITVESRLGEGSTFTLQLPLTLASGPVVEEAREAMGSQATGAVSSLSGQGQSILLVEDNEPAIIQLTDILQAEGYHVMVAHNGQEALRLIEQQVPHAMILDLMMPEVDGFQVLKAIRSVERTAQIPVLILTAKHVTKQDLNFLKGNHIHQLIQKGDINKAGLLAAVARMIAPPSEKPASPPALSPAGGGRRRFARPGKPVVLVVEDHPDNLRTMRALLQEAYTILEATDGQVGVEQARSHQPDLILMDIALPVMDGYQALAVIREDESLRDIPVCAVTASAMKGNREDILARGFDAYISKPIDERLLQATLHELLHGNQ